MPNGRIDGDIGTKAARVYILGCPLRSRIREHERTKYIKQFVVRQTIFVDSNRIRLRLFTESARHRWRVVGHTPGMVGDADT